MAKKVKKKNKGIGSRDTIRQKRLVSIIARELGKVGKGEGVLTMTAMMIEAGYSESTAREQSKVLSGIQSKLDPVVSKFIEKRDLAFDLLTPSKMRRSGASTLAYIIDLFTKNTELLSGRATERNYSLPEEEKERLRKLLE